MIIRFLFQPIIVNILWLKNLQIDLAYGFKFMDYYMCLMCGYIYDPEIGDPAQSIIPGTSFENVPEDWVCPLCYVDKTEFELIDDI